jgi:hypothetical protein
MHMPFCTGFSLRSVTLFVYCLSFEIENDGHEINSQGHDPYMGDLALSALAAVVLYVRTQNYSRGFVRSY